MDRDEGCGVALLQDVRHVFGQSCSGMLKGSGGMLALGPSLDSGGALVVGLGQRYSDAPIWLLGASVASPAQAASVNRFSIDPLQGA